MKKSELKQLIREIIQETISENQNTFDITIKSKTPEKDGGGYNYHKMKIQAKNEDQAKIIAMKQWDNEFSDSDLSFVGFDKK
jgi:hypothetical protein